MRLLLYSLLLACALCCAPALPALPDVEPAVPPDLWPWVPWVLHPQDPRPCPLNPNAPEPGETAAEGARICAWPGRLRLDLGHEGGTFAQTWQVFADTWISLPGDAENWPQDVREDGAPLPVVLHAETPAVRLGAGTHVISGRFRWPRPPDGLSLPARTVLVALVFDGMAVASPQQDRDGRLWLGDPAAAAPQEGDQLTLSVYRRIDDDLPLRVTTRIELDLSGQTRQLELGPVLVPAAIPLRIQSPLPSRLDSDGRLRVQARPGHWVLEVGARIGGDVSALTPGAVPAPWPAFEVWSFAARPDLRQVDLSGATPVDPRQAGVPADWSDLPAYRLAAGQTLHLKERRRGDPDPGPDRLTLERDLWPDLDGRAFSVRDRISGQLTRSWRLSAQAPLDLGAIQVDGEPRLITRLTPDDPPGVELRHGRLDLLAHSRIRAPVRTLVQVPAGGWDRDFTHSRTHLCLAPGWDLFAVTGTDNLPDSWLGRWTLLDLFLVLILALGSARLWGWPWGLTAGLTLILTWQVPQAPHLVWVNLLAAAALGQVLSGAAAGAALMRLRTAVTWYRRLALVALLVVGLPFVAGQVRTGLYPHLERPAVGLGTNADRAPLAARPAAAPPTTPGKSVPGFGAQPAEAPVPDDSAVDGRTKGLVIEDGDGGHGAPPPPVIAAARAEPTEPDAVVQSGAGVPDWQWRRFELTWTGTVVAGEGARLWLTGPRWHLLWSLFGALLTVVLGLRMSGLIGRPRNPAPTADSAAALSLDPGRGTGAGGTGAGTGGPGSVWPPADLTPERAGARPMPGQVQPEPAGLGSWGTIPTPAVEPVTQIEPETAAPFSEPRVPPLALAVVLGSLLLTGVPVPAPAAGLPGPDLLRELRARLLTPPDCLPDCVDVPHLALRADPERLTLNLTLDAVVPIAAAVPGSPGGWMPTELSLDGSPFDILYREGDELLLVPLPAGRHRLDLTGPLPARPQVEIPLPLRPRELDTTLHGWSLEGLDAGGLPGPQVRLLRLPTGDDHPAIPLDQGTLPPLLRVERRLRIGRDWRVETRIRRLSPAEFPVSVGVSLLPGEAVQTPGLAPQDGQVLVNLAPGETETDWRSTLAPAPALHLTAVADPRLTETWTLDLSPRWHLSWSGPAPIHRLAGERWQPTWRPLPGEGLVLVFTQPTAVPGPTLTIDRVDLRISLGRRAREGTLRLDLRTTQGGSHPIRLPAGAEPTALRSGTRDLPLPKPGDPLEVPLLPGEQSVLVEWRERQATGLLVRPRLPDLGSPAVNITLGMRVPQDRWVLFTGGPRIGPVVLFWGVLLVLTGLAIGLGRLRLTPLKWHDWLLLGIGLSLAEIWVLILVAGWLIGLGLRRRLAPETPRWRFNLIQVGLLVLTLLAGAGLIGAVSQGLLGTPEMQIMGNGSGAGLLAWYQDRTAGPLPAVWVLSVPIWVYRALMLAWALWLALRILDWMRWGWEGTARPVLWRGAARGG